MTLRSTSHPHASRLQPLPSSLRSFTSPLASLSSVFFLSLFFSLCLFAPSHAIAEGFSAFDPLDEVVIVGEGSVTTSAQSRGVWSGLPTYLRLETPAAEHISDWFSEGEEAQVGDGFVRLRLRPSKRLQSLLMLRSSVPSGDLNLLSGYGLLFNKGGVEFKRFDGGVSTSMGVSKRLKGLSKHSRLEVLVWMIGPHIIAQVYDERLRMIASLVVTDPKYPKGRVGVRVLKKQGGGTKYTLLSIRKASVEKSSREVPVGKQRAVLLRSSDLDAIPSSLRRRLKVLQEEKHTTPPQTLVKTSPKSLEWLLREGVQPLEVSANIPHLMINPSYREAMEFAPERTSTGFQIDRSYLDADMVEALLRGYHARYPSLTRLVQLGESHEGRPIWALKISDHPELDEDEPAILLNASHHGSELLSTDFAMDAIQQLLERYKTHRRVRRWVDSFEIWCVPLVNPDGNMQHLRFSTGEGRKNGRDSNGDGVLQAGEGVDLNRNYPFQWGALGGKGSSSNPQSEYFRGSAPGSEPETQAMMRLADSEHFAASISFHTLATKILTPYTIDGVRSPKPNDAWSVAETVAAATPVQVNERNYRVVSKLYPVDGVDQDWLRAAHGTVALLVEGPLESPLDPEKRRLSIEGTRPTWTALLDRTLSGPTVHGQVLDADGEPVAAEITIKEVKLRAGERWSSRCRDGRFDRFFSKPGRYTLRATFGGHEVEQRVQVKEGRLTTVKLVLEELHQTEGTQEVARSCDVSALCAVDTLCAARAGACVRPGAARWCLIGGVCVSEGARSEGGSQVCDPAHEQTKWSVLAHSAN